ncbi:hypothetical protein [Streptomyces sp. KLOTTS4A1]|uniref:hypothetical protein n=1 Tax=Streptomyces sp. KLOTTS4A1 TaxID=3390996 RepID=UPI0039F6426A
MPPHSTLVARLIFVAVFYAHGLPLGLAWRTCESGGSWTNMVHALTSSTVAAAACVGAWFALQRGTNVSGGRAGSWGRPALGVLVPAVVLLWPAMAVWHALAGVGPSCAPDGIPQWWPVWLPLG